MALRVALITGWCVWAVMAWWSAPRPADVERVRADIAADNIAAYQWALSWERPTVSSWGSGPTLRSPGPAGSLFVWRTHDWRTYYVVVDRGYFSASIHESRTPQAESIRAAVWASLRGSGRPLAGDVRPKSPFLAAAVVLVCLVILITGPAPVLGTRWYWFWIGTWVPFGLGTLAWLIFEHPWSRRVVSSSEPGVDKRYRGLTGFLISVGASIALGLLGLLFGTVFDTWLIPEIPG